MAGKVELGFLEKITDELISTDFPSKVGGKPVWLNLKHLPSTEQLICKKCGFPMIFLLQIYTPCDDDDRCHHRTLFVFMCKTANCCVDNTAENFLVLRCQLPKLNEFYAYETLETGNGFKAVSAHDYHKLCKVCGCLGSKSCSRCKVSNYCSKHHQLVDWKSGHKEVCNGSRPVSNNNSSYCLPEFEIEIETEELKENEEKSEIEKFKEYEDFLRYSKAQEHLSSTDVNDMENIAASNSDKQYKTFRKIIDQEPEQILRYKRNGTPLWVSNENIPSVDQIPSCKCGSPRQFEFQILPQLLNHLSLDSMEKSIDWGTLAIYTCSEDCETGNDSYHQEFIWKQDF